MNLMTWALKMRKYRKLILKRMKLLNMKTAEVAALANLSVVTVSNFLEERTFSPHGRTIEALFEGVGIDIVLVERHIKGMEKQG